MVDEIISVEFERSGGFTGIPVRLILNDKLLSAGETAEILYLIESSGFLRLQIADMTDQHMPDQFFYKISVETSGSRHSIALYEQQITDDLRPLIRFLSGKAKTNKK
jgi:hypothetical protein